MKKIALITIFAFLNFLFIKINVYAEKTYTCYYYTNTTIGDNHAAKIILKNGATEDEKTYVTKYSEGILENAFNKQNLVNWGEHKDFGKDLEFDGQKWFQKNKKCFDNVIVVYNFGKVKSIIPYVSDSKHKDSILKLVTNHYTTDEFKIYTMSLFDLKEKKCIYNNDTAAVSITINNIATKATTLYSKEGSPNTIDQPSYLKNWNSNIVSDSGKTYDVGYTGKENYIISKECPEHVVYAHYKNKTTNNNEYNIYVTNSYNLVSVKKAIEDQITKEHANSLGEYFIINLPLNEKASIDKQNPTDKDSFDFDFCGDSNVLKAAKFAGYILFVVKILVPLSLIIFGSIDFIKAMVASDPNKIKDSGISLAKRTLAGIIIFFIPTIISLVLSLITTFNNDVKTDYNKCYKCISNPGDC